MIKKYFAYRILAGRRDSDAKKNINIKNNKKREGNPLFSILSLR